MGFIHLKKITPLKKLYLSFFVFFNFLIPFSSFASSDLNSLLEAINQFNPQQEIYKKQIPFSDIYQRAYSLDVSKNESKDESLNLDFNKIVGLLLKKADLSFRRLAPNYLEDYTLSLSSLIQILRQKLKPSKLEYFNFKDTLESPYFLSIFNFHPSVYGALTSETEPFHKVAIMIQIHEASSHFLDISASDSSYSFSLFLTEQMRGLEESHNINWLASVKNGVAYTLLFVAEPINVIPTLTLIELTLSQLNKKYFQTDFAFIDLNSQSSKKEYVSSKWFNRSKVLDVVDIAHISPQEIQRAVQLHRNLFNSELLNNTQRIRLALSLIRISSAPEDLHIGVLELYYAVTQSDLATFDQDLLYRVRWVLNSLKTEKIPNITMKLVNALLHSMYYLNLKPLSDLFAPTSWSLEHLKCNEALK